MSLYTSLGKYAMASRRKKPRSDWQYRPDLGLLSVLRVVNFGVSVVQIGRKYAEKL